MVRLISIWMENCGGVLNYWLMAMVLVNISIASEKMESILPLAQKIMLLLTFDAMNLARLLISHCIQSGSHAFSNLEISSHANVSLALITHLFCSNSLIDLFLLNKE